MITKSLSQVYRIHCDALWTLDPTPERSRYLNTVQGYGLLRPDLGEYHIIDNHVYVTAEFFVRLAMHVLIHRRLPRRHRVPWQRDVHDRDIQATAPDPKGFRFGFTLPDPPLAKRIAGTGEGELVLPFHSDSKRRKRAKNRADFSTAYIVDLPAHL